MKTTYRARLFLVLLTTLLPSCQTHPPSPDPVQIETLENAILLHKKRLLAVQHNLQDLRSTRSAHAQRIESAEEKIGRLELLSTRLQVQQSVLARKHQALRQTHLAWSRHHLQQQLLALEADLEMLHAKRQRIERDLRNLPSQDPRKSVPLVIGR